MYSLAFDTTAAFCSIVLTDGEKIIDRFDKKMDFGQAETLMPEIENMLNRQQLQFNDLSLVTVCTGPGSFTGVRSSVSAARAFALACPEVKVCGVSAFDAYAADFSTDELAEVNVVLIETKREDFYVQYYDKKLNKLKPANTAFYEEIIRELAGKKVSFSGDGVERFLSRPSGLSLHAIKMPLTVPIDKLALIGINKFNNKCTDFPKPMYLKAPDVCIK